MVNHMNKRYYDLVEFDFYYLGLIGANSFDDCEYYLNELIEKMGLVDFMGVNIKKLIPLILGGSKNYKRMRVKALLDNIMRLWVERGNFYEAYYNEHLDNLDL